ncbi:hypothetical protein FQA39_LY09459 [Lamprigera yunnana]|nr:hypothetical protein FQA39_LY09459 [Lamprigera yunnana]
MSSGFITENEIAEARKKKQEEWERVRKADDPIEAPEQPYDPRSLYERLQEQKQRKELEYEEAHKLKNMIKGLDDDEIEFLDLVDRTKIAADRRKNLEEERELSDYRNRVAHLQEQSLDQKLQAEVVVNKPKMIGGTRSSQTKLLKGVIVPKSDILKRKSSTEIVDNVKISKLDVEVQTKKNKRKQTDIEEHQVNLDTLEKVTFCSEPKEMNSKTLSNKPIKENCGLTCVGILPGLGYYEESSSEDTSDSDEMVMPNENSPKFDLIGRKIVARSKETEKKECSNIVKEKNYKRNLFSNGNSKVKSKKGIIKKNMVKKGNITAVSSDEEEDVEFDIATNIDVEWNRADSPFVFDQLIRDPKKDDFVLTEFKIEKNIKPVYYVARILIEKMIMNTSKFPVSAKV